MLSVVSDSVGEGKESTYGRPCLFSVAYAVRGVGEVVEPQIDLVPIGDPEVRYTPKVSQDARCCSHIIHDDMRVRVKPARGKDSACFHGCRELIQGCLSSSPPLDIFSATLIDLRTQRLAADPAIVSDSDSVSPVYAPKGEFSWG